MSKSGFTHYEDQTFDHGVWKDVCHWLYPRTLTALLNGQPTKMPKWMAARWKPFEHLSAKQKCLWTQTTNCQFFAFATRQGLAKLRMIFCLLPERFDFAAVGASPSHKLASMSFEQQAIHSQKRLLNANRPGCQSDQKGGKMSQIWKVKIRCSCRSRARTKRA